MSQHNSMSKTHKKLTHVAIAIMLAAAPLGVPALVSANSDTTGDTSTSHEATTTGYDESGYRAFPDKKDRRSYDESSGQSMGASYSDDGSASSQSDDHEDKSWDKDKGYGHGSGYEDKKDFRKDKDFDRDKFHKDGDKHAKPQPAKPVEKVEKIEKTEVIHKPAEVRQEVNQNVNQETNVVIERETVERPVVQEKVVREVVKQPVVHEKPVVHKPAVAAAVAQPKPVVVAPAEAEKGELVETGADTKTNTLAGLGILGALGALSILNRRKSPARN